MAAEERGALEQEELSTFIFDLSSSSWIHDAVDIHGQLPINRTGELPYLFFSDILRLKPARSRFLAIRSQGSELQQQSADVWWAVHWQYKRSLADDDHSGALRRRLRWQSIALDSGKRDRSELGGARRSKQQSN